ncbi:DNA ligase 1-like [Montipora capricornis]|uniref:DNA ligase 1-like n=1 Tax=Montipora capricornis TaxID=246305 RepID=UPI0035F1ABC9
MDAGDQLLKNTFGIDGQFSLPQTVVSQNPVQDIPALPLPSFDTFLGEQLTQNLVPLSQEIQPLNGKKRKNEEMLQPNVNETTKKKRTYKNKQSKVDEKKETGEKKETEKRKRSYKPRKPKVVVEDECPIESVSIEVIEEGKCESETSVTQDEMKEEEEDEKKMTPSLVDLIDTQIENNSNLLYSYCSQLVKALIDDTRYRVAKSQPVLTQLKMDVFTSASSILKCSKKQKDHLEKMKSTLLTTWYPVSSQVMQMTTDKPVFSSKIIENLSRKKKEEEEKMILEKQVEEMDCHSNGKREKKKEENTQLIVKPTDPAKSAKKALYEAFCTLSSYSFTNVMTIEGQKDFDESLDKLKVLSSAQWLQIVGVLTRLAKKKMILFRDFQKSLISGKEMKDLIETHVAGEADEIPPFFKIKRKK